MDKIIDETVDAQKFTDLTKCLIKIKTFGEAKKHGHYQKIPNELMALIIKRIQDSEDSEDADFVFKELDHVHYAAPGTDWGASWQKTFKAYGDSKKLSKLHGPKELMNFQDWVDFLKEESGSDTNFNLNVVRPLYSFFDGVISMHRPHAKLGM